MGQKAKTPADRPHKKGSRTSYKTFIRTPLLVSQILYGGGLRLNECLRLRVQDVDFGQQLLVVRDGKGQKDRTTTLPDRIVSSLKKQLEIAKTQHHKDLQNNFGRVSLPNALARKYPNANREWKWQNDDLHTCS